MVSFNLLTIYLGYVNIISRLKGFLHYLTIVSCLWNLWTDASEARTEGVKYLILSGTKVRSVSMRMRKNLTFLVFIYQGGGSFLSILNEARSMEIRPNISCSPSSGTASATLMRNITKTWLRTKMKSLVFLLKWPQAEKFKLFWREQRPKDTNLPGLSRLNWHVQAVTVQPCQGNKLLIWSLESRFRKEFWIIE